MRFSWQRKLEPRMTTAQHRQIQQDSYGVIYIGQCAASRVWGIKKRIKRFTGNDTVRFRPYSTGSAIGDAWVLDYTELTLQTRAVAEPGTLALLGFGIAGLSLSRRRKV